MIELIIFSDIRVYAEGLSRLLSEQDGIGLVSIANTLINVTVKLESLPQYIVLLDMTMRNSCALTRQLARQYPQSRVIALASPDEELKLAECAEIGISGYVSRSASIEDLTAEILRTHSGEFRCPPRLANLLLNKFGNKFGHPKNKFGKNKFGHPNKIRRPMRDEKEYSIASKKSEPARSLDELTRREQQILSLMGEGLSNKQISASLIIEVSTVKNHVHNILVKLGVQNRVQAVNRLKYHNVAVGTGLLFLHEMAPVFEKK